MSVTTVRTVCNSEQLDADTDGQAMSAILTRAAAVVPGSRVRSSADREPLMQSKAGNNSMKKKLFLLVLLLSFLGGLLCCTPYTDQDQVQIATGCERVQAFFFASP